MARGFESKDVEYQQAERARQRSLHEAPIPPHREATSRRETVNLSLRRMRGELHAARAAAHRSMIEHAIATLEAELASLD